MEPTPSPGASSRKQDNPKHQERYRETRNSVPFWYTISMLQDPQTAATQACLHDLKSEIEHVAFDRTTRLLFSTDASIYQMMPVGVVWPQHEEEVIAAVEIAHRHHIPLLPRGGGSSLAGQAIGHALILDFSRYMDRILAFDPERRTVKIQTGALLGRLNKQAAAYNLTYGPDPASADRATIGGVIGNNATGAHSIRYGMTHNHLLGADVVLSDGSKASFSALTDKEWQRASSKSGRVGAIYQAIPYILSSYSPFIRERFPETFRSVAGYNLKPLLEQSVKNPATLLAGSEGTLGIMTSATLNLVPRPEHKHLYLLHFQTLDAALDAVPPILETDPSAVELLDEMLISLTRQSPQYREMLEYIQGQPAAVLMVEYAGYDERALHDKAHTLQAYGPSLHLPDLADQEKVWKARKVGLGLLLSKRGDTKPITFIEDAAVPVQHLKAYTLGLRKFAREIGVESIALYAHASAGCLHVRPMINLKTEQGLKHMRLLAEKSLQLVLKYGGTTSGEHGEGIARGEFTEGLFGPELMDAFQEVKTAFDPNNLLNPGKILDSPRMDDEELLRYGSTYATPHKPARTRFHFAQDHGFDGAVEMCNGAGVCRQLEDGVMCPSFQATREEQHSTRGRANALRHAMTGNLGPDGMTSREVYDVLDLCLSCQACASECPSAVDMAKLKAEFLFHYHQEHGVPFRSRLFANIDRVYRFLQPVAPLVNLFLRLVPGSTLQVLGIHSRRSFPPLARERFTTWFKNRPSPFQGDQDRQIVLFHDTFMEHNHPHIGKAAVRALETMGYQPIVLTDKVDSGRPAVSKGLLNGAKKRAEKNLALLYPYAARGVPIVGCEPSSVIMLTREYPDLLPGRASQAVAQAASMLDEFLVQAIGSANTPLSFDNQPRKILFHGHCQQKANYGTDSTRALLESIPNTEVEETDAGCCGMAGSFGYEKEHHHLSLQIAELALAPHIRRTAPQTMICAPGTSCRDQIQYTTGRTVQHPIEVFADALQNSPS